MILRAHMVAASDGQPTRAARTTRVSSYGSVVISLSAKARHLREKIEKGGKMALKELKELEPRLAEAKARLSRLTSEPEASGSDSVRDMTSKQFWNAVERHGKLCWEEGRGFVGARNRT